MRRGLRPASDMDCQWQCNSYANRALATAVTAVIWNVFGTIEHSRTAIPPEKPPKGLDIAGVLKERCIAVSGGRPSVRSPDVGYLFLDLWELFCLCCRQV